MSDIDYLRYTQLQLENEDNFENRCRRCGACCGGREFDPCVHLAEDSAGKFYCDIYEKRLGKQLTVSGKEFNCVPIRSLLKFDLPYQGCAYLRKAAF